MMLEPFARKGDGSPGKDLQPDSVLFMCGRNSIRSPMAEALARRLLPPSIFVASAGVRPGERDPFVDTVLAEIGLGLGERHPHLLSELDDSYFDMIITLAPEAHHAALELTRTVSVEVEYWPTFDPSAIEGSREQVLQAYRDVRDGLQARIAERFAKLTLGNDSKSA